MKVIYSNLKMDTVEEYIRAKGKCTELPSKEKKIIKLNAVIEVLLLLLMIPYGTLWHLYIRNQIGFCGDPSTDIEAIKYIVLITALMMGLYLIIIIGLSILKRSLLIRKKLVPVYLNNKLLERESVFLEPIFDGLKIQNSFKEHLLKKQSLLKWEQCKATTIRVYVDSEGDSYTTYEFDFPDEVISKLVEEEIVDFSYLDKLWSKFLEKEALDIEDIEKIEQFNIFDFIIR